jgi:hypothetical protein
MIVGAGVARRTRTTLSETWSRAFP